MALTSVKAHNAKLRGDRQLVIWGSGAPRREFLHVDDAADALIWIMTRYSAGEAVNLGSGAEISIFELAELIARVVGVSGRIVVDETKPDGTPRKLLDSTKLINLGWRARIDLRDGLTSMYAWLQAALESRLVRLVQA